MKSSSWFEFELLRKYKRLKIMTTMIKFEYKSLVRRQKKSKTPFIVRSFLLLLQSSVLNYKTYQSKWLNISVLLSPDYAELKKRTYNFLLKELSFLKNAYPSKEILFSPWLCLYWLILTLAIQCDTLLRSNERYNFALKPFSVLTRL